MPLITRADLARVAPHALPHIVTAIVNHADVVLPKYGLATTARLQHFMAHVLVESGHLTALEENLHYSAERAHEVWRSHFPTVASAEPYAHNPEKLANLVYRGRMGNTGPDDGWLNRGEGLLQTTGADWRRRLAAKLGVSVETVRSMLTSEAGMLECAAATYVLTGAPAYADRDDIVGETRRINGGLNGLAGRRAALALCRKIWPRVTPPKPVAVAALPPAPPPPVRTPLPPSPVPPVLPASSKALAPVNPSFSFSALFAFLAAFLGFASGAHAETISVTPAVNDAIGYMLVPALLALVSGGGVGTMLVMPLKRFIDQKTADVLASRVDDLLQKAIAYGAKQAEAYVSRQDFHLNVDGWIQEIAAKYALDHAPALLKQAGGNLVEKIQARLASHEDVLALKSRVANDSAPAAVAPAA